MRCSSLSALPFPFRLSRLSRRSLPPSLPPSLLTRHVDVVVALPPLNLQVPTRQLHSHLSGKKGSEGGKEGGREGERVSIKLKRLIGNRDMKNSCGMNCHSPPSLLPPLPLIRLPRQDRRHRQRTSTRATRKGHHLLPSSLPPSLPPSLPLISLARQDRSHRQRTSTRATRKGRAGSALPDLHAKEVGGHHLGREGGREGGACMRI